MDVVSGDMLASFLYVSHETHSIPAQPDGEYPKRVDVLLIIFGITHISINDDETYDIIWMFVFLYVYST